MIYDGIEQVQAIVLEMLEELDRICKIIGVQYFLIGGTALGAVRHAGFIPWDDDIDVGMLRDDYEKFLAHAGSELGKNYFLQTAETDPYTYFPYAKLRRNGTTFLHWREIHLKMHRGIYLDVFPYDNIPDDDISRRRQHAAVQTLTKLFVYNRVLLPEEKRHGLAGLMRIVLRPVAHVLAKTIPVSLITKILKRSMTLYNNRQTDAIACLLIPKYLVEYMRRETLLPLSSIKFCGRYYTCPNDIHQYLTTHYGDYMKLPPEHERVNHKPHILDTGVTQ